MVAYTRVLTIQMKQNEKVRETSRVEKSFGGSGHEREKEEFSSGPI